MASARIDRGTVDAVARSTGFRRGGVEKALRLLLMLDEISRDRYLAPRVVLKGGTALNLFHGPLRRLSIDADLDYIGAIELDGMRAERPTVLATLDEIGGALGYRVRRRKDEHAGTVTELRYRSLSGGDELIKVDLNFLERVTVLGRVEHAAPNAGLLLEGIRIPCLPADELAGSKLSTLCLRGAPRDLFDVAGLSSMDLDKRAVRKVALFHGFLEGFNLANLDTDAPSRVSQAALENQVGALVPRKSAMDYGAIVSRARAWTDSLLPLNERERRFQDGLELGEVRPELLFESVHFHPRIAEHPGILRRMAVKRPRRSFTTR